MIRFSFFLLLIFACVSITSLRAQPIFHTECDVSNDLGGILSSGDPDVISFDPPSGTESIQTLHGCFAPSDADYNDLFRIFVPDGYVLSAIQFGYINTFFEDLTEVNFSMWYGTDCQPLGSPAVYSGGYMHNTNYDNWYGNMIAGAGPLPGNSWYSFRIDMNATPSSTSYYLHFTLNCDDAEAPEFTTAAGSLDASLSCSNLAGIANALAMEPAGSDNSGSVSLVLDSDQTTPAPGCANAYTRVRIWSLEDDCGNSSAETFTQTIEVYDNTPPTFTMIAGTLDVVLECDDAVGLANALAATPTGADACGSANLILISDITTPDPMCSKAYNRVRTWRLVDECGNESLALFHQSIQVEDTTPPVAVPVNGVIAISDPEGYELTPADVLNLAATYDACGEISIEITPAVLGCDLLGQIVPVTVEVTDECGNMTAVVAMIEVTEDTSIKAPWDNDNIGVTANGSATHSPCEGTYTITSSGFSMPNSDVSHFVYVDLCGDGEIIARVTSVNPNTGWGGVMIRESLQPGARKVALKTGLNNTIRREIRTTPNMNFQLQQSAVIPGPVWFRITRTGNTYNLYTSSNGTQWQFTGSAMLNTGNCVLMGIYTESSNNNIAVTSIFDEVTVSGGVMPLAALPGGFIEAAQVEQLSPVPGVFPNPGTGDFKVDLSPYAGLNVMMELADMNGKQLFSREITAGKTPEPLSLTNYPAGMYLIRIQPESGSPHVLKLILK